MNRPFCKGVLAFLVILIIGAHTAATAQSREAPRLIRDTEIESMLHKWSEPVIKAAGLDPASINFILVQHPDINAFVAGGPNIFIYSGLLTESDNAGEVIGVIAHELGHIRGGHLVRMRGALENASYESLLGTILGLGAAVLTGEGELASAIMLGSQAGAQNRFLRFSRVQESSADQAALDYLDKADISAKGLVSFMETLENQELLPASQQTEYIRTHPLTRNRIEALRAGLQKQENDPDIAPALADDHARMIAKLTGFIHPEQVSWQYNDTNTSIPAEYARAIADYRQNHVRESLRKMDSLLQREPDNPYFLELKGQMLVDYGRLEQSLPYYEKAISILPDAPLIRAAFGQALVESAKGDEARLEKAVRHLRRAVKDEPRMPRIHRLLATAYGRLGQDSIAKLHLAEEALLQGRTGYAKRQAGAAAKDLEKGSQNWIRAQDILNYIEQKPDNN